MEEPEGQKPLPLPKKEGFLKEICGKTGDVKLRDAEGTEYVCSTDRSLPNDLKYFDMPLTDVAVAFTPIFDIRTTGLSAVDISFFPNNDCPKDLWEKYTINPKFNGWCSRNGFQRGANTVSKFFKKSNLHAENRLKACLDDTHTDTSFHNLTPSDEEEKPTEGLDSEEEVEKSDEEEPLREEEKTELLEAQERVSEEEEADEKPLVMGKPSEEAQEPEENKEEAGEPVSNEEPLEEEKEEAEEEGASFTVKNVPDDSFQPLRGCSIRWCIPLLEYEIEANLQLLRDEYRERPVEKKKPLKSILKAPKEKVADNGPWPMAWGVHIEPGYWKVEAKMLKLCEQHDFRSSKKLHHVLNVWYYVPQLRYKIEYPFNADGIVVPIGGGKVHIYSIRLGLNETDDKPKRNDRPYALFLYSGDGDSRAWEFDALPASLEEVIPIEGGVVSRGYAVISPGSAEESSWFAWNDQCGWMRCEEGCAEELRQTEPGWVPGCQLIKFEATYPHNQWIIKKITQVGLPFDEQVPFFPVDLFYVDDIRINYETGEDGETKLVLYSGKLQKGRIEYYHDQVFHPFPYPGSDRYGGLVCVTWPGPQQRVLRALCIAPLSLWHNPHYKDFYDAARLLSLIAWDRKRKRKNIVEAVADPWQEE